MDGERESQARADFNRPLPWELWLLAYGMLLLSGWALGAGLASIATDGAAQVIACLLFGGFAWGIFAKREWARQLVVFFSCLYFYGGLVMAPGMLVVTWAMGEEVEGSVLGYRLTGVLGQVLISAWSVAFVTAAYFVQRAARGEHVVQQFQTPNRQRPRGYAWRLSLRSLLLATPVVAMVGLAASQRLEERAIDRQSERGFTLSDGRTARVFSGEGRAGLGGKDPPLEYAVFSVASAVGQEPSRPMMMRSLGARGELSRVTIHPATGDPVEFPCETQLFDYRDGELFPHEGRVTLEEFEAFLASNAEEWSVAALVEFAEKRREQAPADPTQ